MAQDQDLGVLPPHSSLGQAQRHDTSDDEEDQLRARKPKIHGTHGQVLTGPPVTWRRPQAETLPAICPGGKGFGTRNTIAQD
jgi:hypothetical protein